MGLGGHFSMVCVWGPGQGGGAHPTASEWTARGVGWAGAER